MDLLDYRGDTAKDCIELPRHEKLDYCIATYPDDGNTVFMAHFRCSRALWRKHFKRNPVLSSDGMAEGVDLSQFNKLVIVDMSFRTSKHTQRMARQANHDRRDPIEVDVLVMDKPAVGHEVYKTVAIKKENFVRDSYSRAVKD